METQNKKSTGLLAILLIFIALVFTQLHGCGGGGSSPTGIQSESGDKEEGGDTKLSAYAGEDFSVKSLQNVELYGRASIREGRHVASYGWLSDANNTAQISLSVDPERPFISRFVAPDVTEESTLRFYFKVTDNLGNTDQDSISIHVAPSSNTERLFNFISFRIVEPDKYSVHGRYFPIDGNPRPGKYKAMASVSGYIQDINFSMVGDNGKLISPLNMKKTGDGEYFGDIEIPEYPFSIRAHGTLTTTDSFDVAYEKLFSPQPLKIDFRGVDRLMYAGESHIMKIVVHGTETPNDYRILISSPRPDIISEYKEIISVSGHEIIDIAVNVPENLNKYDHITIQAEATLVSDPSTKNHSSVSIEVMPR
jgi:hypothetical protein